MNEEKNDEKSESSGELVQCPHCNKYVSLAESKENLCPYCKEPLSEEKTEKGNFLIEKAETLFSGKKSRIWKVALIGFAILLVVYLVGINSENTRLEKQMDELQVSYDSLTERYQDLVEDYESLKEDNLEVSAKLRSYQDQQDEVEKLTKQVEELTTANQTLTKEKEDLNNQIAKQAEELRQQEQSVISSGAASSSMSEGTSGSNTVSSEVGTSVWISATGSKYHSIPNCGRMDPSRATQMSLSEAQSRGYDACKNCH